MSSSSGQSISSVNANARYFLDHLREYEESVSKIDTYRNIHRFISERVAGVQHLLDIGNGGVFDYDTSTIAKITAIDLFLEDLPEDIVSKYFPANATVRQGSALALPEADGKFDMVLMVMLLHHLSGKHWRECWQNAQKAIDEAWRVLKPGGRLLIVESCVPSWFFQAEKPAFWLLSRTLNSVFDHPITFQFPAPMIAGELAKRSQSVESHSVPKGRHVLQFGFKVPSALTPVQVFGIEARK
jgi:SAM-dependent methyltransferase